jgi:hypothetical protein
VEYELMSNALISTFWRILFIIHALSNVPGHKYTGADAVDF